MIKRLLLVVGLMALPGLGAEWPGFERGMGIGGWLTNYKRFNVLPQERRLPITIGDLEHFDTYVTEADVAYIASLGFDHIRLGFDQVVIEEKPGVYRERTLRKIDEFLEWCARHRLNVVLNLHKAIGNYCDIQEKVELLDDEGLQQRFVDLWLMMERRYAKHPEVAFEILNEVRNVDPEKWNALADRCVRALRRENPRRWLVVGSRCWNGIDALAQLKVWDDPRVVYTFHMYTPFEFTHQRGVLQADPLYYNRTLEYPTEDVERYRDYGRLLKPGSDGGYAGVKAVDRDYLARCMQGAFDFVKAHPDKILWNGEFGTIRHAPPASRVAYMRDVVSLCREHGIPYCVWNYLSTPNDGNRFSLVDDDNRKFLSKELLNACLGRSEKVAEIREEYDRRVAEIRATGDKEVPTAYFLSERGDDAADGRTKGTAWRTVARLNREKLASGSWVLFERGGLYRGEVQTCAGVTYGAWGKGAKPRIYGSPENGAVASKWQKTEVENVWAYNIGHKDVGTLVFDGGAAHAIKIVFRTDAKTGKRYSMYTGRPFESYRDLDTDLHFWHDYYEKGTGKVYLYSRQNPGERFKSIEFNVRTAGFRVGGNDNVTIGNFDIRYVGGHGVSARTCRNLHVANCTFEWIGGSIQAEGLFGRDHPTRYGNGVEVYGGCEDFVVENCAFDQVYDAGVTHQYNIPEKEGMKRYDHRNVVYRNNVFRRCCYSIEYFLTALNGNQSRMENVLFERNLSLDCGFGFCEQRPDTGVAAHVKAWRKNEFRNRATKYVIRDNVFCGSKDMVLQICSSLRNADGSDSMPEMTGNVIVTGPSKLFGTISQTSAEVIECGFGAQKLLDSLGAGNVIIDQVE